MPGLFQGIEVGKSALLGQQVSLQTIGHNIANVNTPGYTRQRVSITTAYPEVSAYGPIGSGLNVTDVRHIRDLFLGAQYREAQKDLGQWAYKSKSLQQIESVFSEPQDGSLNEVLDNFWNDWSALSSDAENSGHRRSLVADAQQIINTFGQLANSLEELKRSTDSELASMTDEVNQLTSQIARLNKQIVAQELDNSNANDLRDKRDHLIDRLSVLIDVNTHDQANGARTVYMGSMALVDGPDAMKIGVKSERHGDEVTHRMVWQGTEVRLKNVNGQLAGLVQTRDEIIPRYIDQLNRLARTIVDQVNSLHRAGYGLEGSSGLDFFDPAFTEARDLRLNREVLLDPSKIAASDSSNPDDRSNGQVASRLADLRNAMIMSNDTATINQFYHSLVADLGVETREAESFNSNFELVSQQIENQRQSVEGVSLDEEMANMVKAQHAFDAASRLISVMDEALDTIITRMGIVG